MPEDKFGTMDLDQAMKGAQPIKKPGSKSGVRPLPPSLKRALAPSLPSVPAIKLTISLLTAVAAAAKRIELSEEARALLEDDLTVVEFLDRLVEAEQFAEALRLMTQVLPKRESVWWGLQCIRQVPVSGPPDLIKATQQGIEKWVTDPSDENRRAAHAAAEALGYTKPAGCLGLAVFCSGGSLGPTGIPDVPPAEHLTTQTVVNALLLAGVVIEPEKAADRYRQYILEGIKVAGGMSRWKESKPPTPSPVRAAVG